MKFLATVVLFVAHLTAPFAGASQEAPEYVSESETTLRAGTEPVRVLLAVGEERVFELNFAANAGASGISIGNPQILATTLVKIGGNQRQLVIKPLRTGRTSITIRQEDGQLRLQLEVEVAGTNIFRLEGELRQALTRLAGVSVRRVGPLLLVEGAVATPDEAGLLHQVLIQRRYAEYTVNETLLSPKFFDGLADRAFGEIVKFAPKVRVRAMGEQLWLEGEVENLDQANRAERVANFVMPDTIPAGPLADDPKARHLAPRSQVQSFLTVKPH